MYLKMRRANYISVAQTTYADAYKNIIREGISQPNIENGVVSITKLVPMNGMRVAGRGTSKRRKVADYSNVG